MQEVYLVLHNIRSARNVGSIFRTADGAGVKKIFLTGYTPEPIDEFGRIRQEIHKTALGAEKTVEWERCRDIGRLIQKLKNEKNPIKNLPTKSCYGKIWSTHFLIGLEQTNTAIDYRKFKPKFPLALVVGNEVRGLSAGVLKKCDAVIEIPMRGEKESLNVAVAAGIALYEILK